jgi:NAD(P)H-hydrate epimerase
VSTRTFVTDTGLLVPAITTEQMREVDRVAVEELGPNLFQMMENAGRGLALTVLEAAGAHRRSTRIVVMAGTGGNGGGGICAARHLANRGADVAVVVSDPNRLTPVAEHQLHVYRATTGRLASISDLPALPADLIVDAVIGYSLKEAPRGPARRMVEHVGSQRVPVISLDVPSGIDATTGMAPGVHVRASTTLTLALPKRGLDAAEAGELWLADLGIPIDVYRRARLEVPSGLFGDRFRVPLQPV